MSSKSKQRTKEAQTEELKAGAMDFALDEIHEYRFKKLINEGLIIEDRNHVESNSHSDEPKAKAVEKRISDAGSTN